MSTVPRALRLALLRRPVSSNDESVPPVPPVPPPVVKSEGKMADDPVRFLMAVKQQHPDIFVVERPSGARTTVVCDPSMFEEVLTFDDLFGNPVTPNMSVNKRVFLIDAEDLEKHEQDAVKQLRRFLLRNDGDVAAAIAGQLLGYMRTELGAGGQCDLRELGERAVFWPVSELRPPSTQGRSLVCCLRHQRPLSLETGFGVDGSIHP